MGAPDSRVVAYEDAIGQYADAILERYVAQLAAQKDGSAWGASKEFNDPIWGTIVLEPHEVAVLDSPLLQRLRRIRQLGVAHLVYPGAVHTRLEHSIGVCHQVTRLAESINRHQASRDANGSNAAAPLLGDRTIRLLRLTGLCHDIGHGLMSHVVENALRNDDACQELLFAFKKELGKDGRPQLSEIAAYCMARTEAFSSLIAQALRIAGLPSDPTLASDAANLIVGIHADDSMPLLHELITGPFDADKIDYMPRDATMCGVPIVTDVNRLIQKVRAVRVSADQLPDELAHVVKIKGHQPGYTVTVVGLAPSGASTLDEVALGRSLMFDKIYRHHKVRAAESMVAAIVDQIGDLLEPDSTILPLRVFDDELLSLDRAQLGPQNPADDARIRIGLDIVDRLNRRELFVRAFAFSQHLPNDPYRGRKDHRAAIEEMCRQTNDPGGRRRFVEKVVEFTEQIAPMLDPPLNLEPYSGNVGAYIWVDPPASSIVDQKPDTDHAYLIDHDRIPQLVSQVNPQMRGLSDAYVNTRDMGYVFTVRELSPAVHIAAEVTARVMYGARIHDQARVHSKQPIDTLTPLRERLAEQGFYAQVPADMRPLPNVLQLADATRRLTSIVTNLHGYEPPGTVPEGELGQKPFTNAHVSDWIRQFRAPFDESAFRIAEQIRLIGRQDTNQTIEGFFASRQDGTFNSAAIVPLGGVKDGSAIVAYYSRTAADKHGCQLMDLPQALVASRPIIFVDDFVGRGSTAISYFEGLLGLPDTQHLSQDRPAPLDAENVKRLKSLPVALVFSAGLTGADASVNTTLSIYGLKPVQTYIHQGQSQLPALSLVTDDAFVEECSRIGTQLLADTGHDADWIAQRKLGYGNHGLLIVFPYNTPTATLTALWKEGSVDDQPWQPLVPRLKKTSR